jgi:undecaprenyl-diphosphatase
MVVLEAIILGIVQGLTEFIPISSSAHLIIIPWLFDWNDPALTSLPFDVALHLGTLVAVLAFFADDWLRLIRAGITSLVERRINPDPDRRLAWLLVIGSIPGGIAGVLMESRIEGWFHQANHPIKPAAMVAMAVIIALLGLALLMAEQLARHERRMDSLSLRDGIVVGLAQALAIFPGVSRSGSTITAGLAIGIEREDAARFSFLLSAPIIAGAGLKSLLDIYDAYQANTLAHNELVLFPIGVIAAAISGYLTIKYLLRFLQRNPTNVFVYYRWALAIFIVVVVLARG